MDIEKRKEQIKIEIETREETLKNLKSELNKIENCDHPTNKELYDDIDKFLIVLITVGEYEYILGGDGRSAPWSETRKGSIAKLELNEEFYFTHDQIQILKDYVNNTYKPDHIELI